MSDQLDLVDGQLVADAIAASTRPTIAPVEILHVPDHSYLRGPKGSRGCKAIDSAGKPCGKAHFHPVHNLPTLNETLTHSWEVYQGAAKHWRPWLIDAVHDTGLPRDLGYVLASARLTFPTKARRDQDNMRGFIHKALGDALVEGGWIVDDEFYPVCHFEFNDCQARHVAGRRETRILLEPYDLPPAR